MQAQCRGRRVPCIWLTSAPSASTDSTESYSDKQPWCNDSSNHSAYLYNLYIHVHVYIIYNYVHVHCIRLSIVLFCSQATGNAWTVIWRLPSTADLSVSLNGRLTTPPQIQSYFSYYDTGPQSVIFPIYHHISHLIPFWHLSSSRSGQKVCSGL